MFSLEKIKDDPNAVRFYTDFENYDTLMQCLSIWSQKLVGCIFGKTQINAKMEYKNTKMKISINLDQRRI